MIISSQISIGDKLPSFTQEQIKNEPMLFSADYDFAMQNAGVITKSFLKALPRQNIVIDSRVHMLMPNWYPCIPGYHHDDVPREAPNGQPEYINPSYRSLHALAIFNGEICPTEFAIGISEFSDPLQHDIVYKEWHKEVQEKLALKELTKFTAPSNTVIYLDDRTWHQGTAAVGSGWRFFIRASWNTKREVKNEIRKQVQVYLENPMEGW
jgi:hypothetical protein